MTSKKSNDEEKDYPEMESEKDEIDWNKVDQLAEKVAKRLMNGQDIEVV